MQQYQEVLRDIRDNGWREPDDRTGEGRIRYPLAKKIYFDLRKGFPLMTIKRVSFRFIAEELFWFLSGSTDEKVLYEKGVTIWREWATAEKTAKFGREEGDLGPVYGYLWRSFGGDYPKRNGVDQIANVVRGIKESPASTRLIVTGWDPRQAANVELPPCHTMFQFYVERNEILHCQLFQRSADMFLGVPYNIASYALLTHLMAYVTGLTPGYYIHSFGDAHIYFNHKKQVETVLAREPKNLPTLKIVDPGNKLKEGGLEALLNVRYENLKLEGYDPHPKVPAPVAVG